MEDVKSPKQLTTRELDVLRLLLEEKTTQEIASLLQLSRHTIETHRKNLLKKTNTRTVAGLVTFALRHRIA